MTTLGLLAQLVCETFAFGPKEQLKIAKLDVVSFFRGHSVCRWELLLRKVSLRLFGYSLGQEPMSTTRTRYGMYTVILLLAKYFGGGLCYTA